MKAQVDTFANIMADYGMAFFGSQSLPWSEMQKHLTAALEAAEIEGETSWQFFRKITIALLKPAILYSLVMGTIWSLWP